jgi:hypothetical protein
MLFRLPEKLLESLLIELLVSLATPCCRLLSVSGGVAHRASDGEAKQWNAALPPSP